MDNSHEYARLQPSSEEIFAGGWCHVPNGTFDHPYFTKEDRERPLSRREAVLWIAKHVRWTDNCTIRKGQGKWSLRYLAEAWRWTKSKVERFLKTLQVMNILRVATETVSGTARMVITYLFSTCYVAPKSATETVVKHDRDATETNTKTGKQNSPSESGPSPKVEDPFGDCFSASADPEPAPQPKAEKKKSPPTKKYKIPSDWVPTEKTLQWCRDEGLTEDQIKKTTEEFVEYWLEDGRKRPGWDRTFKANVSALKDRGRFRQQYAPKGRYRAEPEIY